jgi:hypothetical protein
MEVGGFMKKQITIISVVVILAVMLVVLAVRKKDSASTIEQGAQQYNNDVNDSFTQQENDTSLDEIILSEPMSSEETKDFEEVQRDLDTNDIVALAHYVYTDLDVLPLEQLPDELQAAVTFGFESGEDITFIYTAAVEYFGEGITFSESDKLPGYIYDGYTNCVYDIDGTPYQFVYKSNEEVYIRNYKDY